MKINKFDENSDYVKSSEDNEKQMTHAQKIKEFITNFTDNVTDIPDWINHIANNTNVPEYKDVIFYNNMLLKKSLKFAEDKNLQKYKEYMLLDGKIEKMQEEIDKLIKYKEEIAYVKGTSELMYSFQKDLLEKDFNNFYKLFLEEQIVEQYDNIYDEVHPDILKNKELKKLIDLYIDTMKYNL